MYYFRLFKLLKTKQQKYGMSDYSESRNKCECVILLADRSIWPSLNKILVFFSIMS